MFLCKLWISWEQEFYKSLHIQLNSVPGTDWMLSKYVLTELIDQLHCFHYLLTFDPGSVNDLWTSLSSSPQPEVKTEMRLRLWWGSVKIMHESKIHGTLYIINVYMVHIYIIVYKVRTIINIYKKSIFKWIMTL